MTNPADRILAANAKAYADLNARADAARPAAMARVAAERNAAVATIADGAGVTLTDGTAATVSYTTRSGRALFVFADGTMRRGTTADIASVA